MKNKKIKNIKNFPIYKKNKIKTQYINKKFIPKLSNNANYKIINYQNIIINAKAKKLKKNLYNISKRLKQQVIWKFLKINKILFYKKFKKIYYYYNFLNLLKKKNTKKKILNIFFNKKLKKKYYYYKFLNPLKKKNTKKKTLKKNYFDTISQNIIKNNININIFQYNKIYKNNKKKDLINTSLHWKKQKKFNLKIIKYLQIIKNLKKIKWKYILLKNKVYYNLKKNKKNYIILKKKIYTLKKNKKNYFILKNKIYNSKKNKFNIWWNTFIYLKTIHYKRINKFFKFFKQIKKIKYNKKIYAFFKKKNIKKDITVINNLLTKISKKNKLIKINVRLLLKKIWLFLLKKELQSATKRAHKTYKFCFWSFFFLKKYKKLPKIWILMTLVTWLKFNFTFYLKNVTIKIKNYYKIFKYQKICTLPLIINKNKQQLYYFFKKEFYIPLLLKLKKEWKRFLIFEINNLKIKKFKKNLKKELLIQFKYTINLNDPLIIFNKTLFQNNQNLINNLLINTWQNFYIDTDISEYSFKEIKLNNNCFLLKKTIKIKKWKKFIKFGLTVFLKEKINNLYIFIFKQIHLYLKNKKKNTKNMKAKFFLLKNKKKNTKNMKAKFFLLKKKKIKRIIYKLKNYLKKYIKLYIFLKNININNQKITIIKQFSNKKFNSKILYLFFNFKFFLKKFLFHFKWNKWKKKQKKFKKKLRINFSFLYYKVGQNFYQKFKIKKSNLKKEIAWFQLLNKNNKYFKNNNIILFKNTNTINLKTYKDFKFIKIYKIYFKINNYLKSLKFKKLKILTKLKKLKFSNINTTNLNYYKCVFTYLKLINQKYNKLLNLKKNLLKLNYLIKI